MRGGVWRIGWLCGWMLFLVGMASAQEGYVVPGGTGNGSSWAMAAGDIQTVIAGGAKDVRVKVGEYALHGEINIPAGVTVTGGYSGSGNERVMQGAQQTVLRATGNSRVATVAGTLEGFTLLDGIATANAGGGAYVKTGGTVRNCIVRNCFAGRYFPRVGDVQMKDRSFKRREDITQADVQNVRGVVFWVNPDPNATEGNRGWLACKMWAKPVGKWSTQSSSEQTTDGIIADKKNAVTDTNGRSHCMSIPEASLSSYPAIDSCRKFNNSSSGILSQAPWTASEMGEWWLPSLGQLRVLFDELDAFKETFKAMFLDVVLQIGTFNEFWSGALVTFLSSTEASEDEIWVMDFGSPDKRGAVMSMQKSNAGVSAGSFMCVPVTSF